MIYVVQSLSSWTVVLLHFITRYSHTFTQIRIDPQNSQRWLLCKSANVGIAAENIFLIGIVGGWSPTGALSTAATNRPIVPALCNYDGEIGGMIGRGNRSTRRKLPQCRFVHHKPHMLPGREPGPLQREPSD
jgi:hypothetical protein